MEREMRGYAARIRQDRWNDRDGKARSRVTIVAEHVEFRPELSKSAGGEKSVPDEAEAADNKKRFVPGF